MKTLTAFVTDGNQRPALAITRSLGRRGIAVVVGAEQSTSLASASKYCVRHVTYPSPSLHPEAFDRFVLELVRRERIDVIVPVTDVTTHLVARNWPALGEYSKSAVPPFDVFEFVANKTRLLKRAAAQGIPIPRTHFVEAAGEVKTLLGSIEYPAVIKPLRSRIRTASGWLATTVQYAHDDAELLRLYRETACLVSYPSMIQQRIVGPGVGVFVLCDRGRLRAAFAHRRLREKPPSGGASVLSESVALDPELLDQTMRLLGPLGWHGVAMMEFKQDRRTGRSYLMEVNGRYWGSLHLAVMAGVDFPFLSCQLALGQEIETQPPYTVGVRSRWLLGDLDHVLLRLFQNDGDQHLPQGSPSRVRTVIDFLGTTGMGAHYDVLSARDPGPFAFEAWQYARDVAAAAAHRLRRLTSHYPTTREESRHAGAVK
jgi:predicted ATP-grasp superfamily ATP-dependent carboligase